MSATDYRYKHVTTQVSSVARVLEEYTETPQFNWRVHTITYPTHHSSSVVYVLFEREYYHHSPHRSGF